MRKRVALLLAVVVFISAVHSLVFGADVIKLKAANYLPVTHPMSQLTGWFCDEVKNRTKGQVEITYHAGGTLLSPVKMYDGVISDIADMGVSHIQYTRGRFPVMEVFDLPLGFPSGWVATQVSSDFFNKYKPAEWKDVQVLYVNTSGPVILQTVSKPVKTLEELKGMKIRATGRMTEVVKALGAVPIPLEMPDVYDALRRAVIEGILVDLSTLKYWKFAEVVKNVTSTWRLGTGITFYFVMNKSKWDALPPDTQKIFAQIAAETKDKQGALWNQMDIEGVDAFKSQGGQVIPLADAEVAKWKKAVEPVVADYKKSMVSKGFKESDVDSWLKYIGDRIEYWKKQQQDKKIAAPF
ncbi:MAG TPA: TRAP transporter substrate-binding protein [Thermodesulfobacteriota bacterium]|nr:TRAP transporter substrate-binding protein [Thermodesulfobacteriota bacterium]